MGCNGQLCMYTGSSLSREEIDTSFVQIRFNSLFILIGDFLSISMNHFDDFDDFFKI